MPETVCVDDVVLLTNGDVGFVQFIGEVENKSGIWYGLTLQDDIFLDDEFSEPQIDLIVRRKNIACIVRYRYGPRFGYGDEIIIQPSSIDKWYKPPKAIIRYIGSVHFASDLWYGVELVGNYIGKNDGSLDGVRYFTCRDSYIPRGLFVHEKRIRPNNIGLPLLPYHKRGAHDYLAFAMSIMLNKWIDSLNLKISDKLKTTIWNYYKPVPFKHAKRRALLELLPGKYTWTDDPTICFVPLAQTMRNQTRTWTFKIDYIDDDCVKYEPASGSYCTISKSLWDKVVIGYLEL